MVSQRVSQYEQRLLAERCAYSTACDEPLADGSPYCAGHRDRYRELNRKAVKAVRRSRRKRKLCALCGKPSKQYRCSGCKVKCGCAPKGVTASVTVQGHAERVEGDGYKRKRYRGRSRRGAPTKDSLDAQDLAFGLSSFERGKTGLAYAARGEGLSKEEREAARLAALGQLDLARRFIEDVLSRHKWKRETVEEE